MLRHTNADEFKFEQLEFKNSNVQIQKLQSTNAMICGGFFVHETKFQTNAQICMLTIDISELYPQLTFSNNQLRRRLTAGGGGRDDDRRDLRADRREFADGDARRQSISSGAQEDGGVGA